MVQKERSAVTRRSRMKKKYRFQKPMSIRVVLEPDRESSGYTVVVPDLQGCLSQGDDLAHAIRMIRDAIECYLDADAELQPYRAPRGAIKRKLYLGWVDERGRPIKLPPLQTEPPRRRRSKR